MNKRERQQWDALYAAAFAVHLDRLTEMPKGAKRPNLFEAAVERAVVVADAGILILRARRDTHPETGDKVEKSGQRTRGAGG